MNLILTFVYVLSGNIGLLFTTYTSSLPIWPPSGPALAMVLDKNSKQIDRLSRLVYDILDISRIRTGKLSLKKEPCDLSSMLMDVIATSREQFEISGSGGPIIEHIEKAVGDWDQLFLSICTFSPRHQFGQFKLREADLPHFPGWAMERP